MSSSSSLPAWLASAIEALQSADVDGWMAIYAPDAVHEFPFAPDGAPRRLEGRAEIAAYMQQMPNILRFGPFDDVRVRSVGDEVIVEATGHHHRASDDAARTLNYVWFIIRRDEKVTHFRDYMNPLQISSIMG